MVAESIDHRAKSLEPRAAISVDALGIEPALPLRVLTTGLGLTLWIALGSLVLASVEGLGRDPIRRLSVGALLVLGTASCLVFRRRVCELLRTKPWVMISVAAAVMLIVASDALVGGPYIAVTLTPIGIAVVVAPTWVVWSCVGVLEVGYLVGVVAAHSPGQLIDAGQLAGVLGQALAYPFAALALLGLAAVFKRFVSNSLAILEEMRTGTPALTPALSYAISHPGQALRALPPGEAYRPRLTPTEVRVVEELARGKRASRIAHEWGVSLATVRTHIRHAKRKTGAKTLPQLAALTSSPDWPPFGPASGHAR